MNVSQLRSFLLVADFGSMKRAAEESFVDLSAMSRRISQLEREFGVTLFTRSGKGLVLTEQGRAILPRVREALTQLNAASRVAAPGSPTTRVTVLLPSMVGPRVRRTLTEAAARAEVSALEFVPTRNELAWEQLRGGEASFAVLHSGKRAPDGRSEMEASFVQLARERMLVAANAAASAHLPDTVDLRDLAGFKYITSDNATAPTFFGQLNALLGWAGVRTRVELPHHDLTYVANILATEAAFSFVTDDTSHPAHQALAEEGVIRLLKAAGGTPPLYTQLLWVDEMLTLGEHAFLRSLVDVLAEERGGQRPEVALTEPPDQAPSSAGAPVSAEPRSGAQRAIREGVSEKR